MSLDRYLAGEDDQLESAIVACMPMIDDFVGAFLVKAPGFASLDDDLRSEGYLMLSQVLPKMRRSFSTSTKTNSRAYLRRAFKEVGSKVLRNHENLGMCQRTWERHTQEGREIPNSTGNADRIHEVVSNPFKLIELRETVYDCCRSPDERRIVEMREQGFTYREIADELGMSLDSVHKYLNAVYGRLQQELNPDEA